MQDQTGQLPYTRTINFGSDLARLIDPLGPIIYSLSGVGLLDCAEFFDKRDAVDFVQGRNPAENLV